MNVFVTLPDCGCAWCATERYFASGGNGDDRPTDFICEFCGTCCQHAKYHGDLCATQALLGMPIVIAPIAAAPVEQHWYFNDDVPRGTP